MGYFEDHLLPSEREAIPYIPVITEYLNFITEKYGDQIALSDPDQSVRYSELADRVARRRQALRALNLPAHGNIGLFDVNSIAEVEWFLAVTTAGYAAVMLPASLSPEVLKNASYHYDLIAVIAGSSLAEKAQGLPVPVLSMDDMADAPADPVPAAPTDRAAIFFTGGTTGTPKGVVLSHRAILRGSHNGTFRPGSMFGQTSVAVLPLTHVFGTIFGVLAGLYSGSHVAVCGNMRNLFKEMARVRPTTMVAVPGMAEMMLSIARSRGPEALGGRLNLVICGAAPVPPRLHAGFMEFGVDVKGGYGMTETANLVSANYDMDEYPTSVGQQYPCQESRIVDGELQGIHLYHRPHQEPDSPAQRRKCLPRGSGREFLPLPACPGVPGIRNGNRRQSRHPAGSVPRSRSGCAAGPRGAPENLRNPPRHHAARAYRTAGSALRKKPQHENYSKEMRWL